MEKNSLTPEEQFTKDFFEEFKELIRDCYWPAVREDGAQWLPQDFGAQFHEAQDNRSLHRFMQKIANRVGELRAADKGEATDLENAANSGEEAVQEYKTQISDLEAYVVRLENELETATVNNNALVGTIKSQDEQIARLESSIAAMRKPATGPAATEHDHNGTVATVTLERNGIKKPRKGVTARAWEIADALMATGKAPTKAELIAHCVPEEINVGTAASIYSKWCQFNGLNPKDPSKPFEAKEKVVNSVDCPTGTATPSDQTLGRGTRPEFIPPPPPPAFLPPPPPPAYFPPPPLPTEPDPY